MFKLEVHPQQKLPREGEGLTRKTPTDQLYILSSVFGTYAAETQTCENCSLTTQECYGSQNPTLPHIQNTYKQ